MVGYSTFVTARLQLGKSFAVTPQAKELVTLGLYSRIHNPIYVFVDVMIFGLILALHLYWLFVLFPLLVALHAFRAHREAKVLQEKFGQPTSITVTKLGSESANSGEIICYENSLNID